MTDALSARVGELTDMGWSLKSQTETTAALETRQPFNWLLFALFIILLFGFGALLYIAFWLLVPKAQLFLVEKDGALAASGDVWMVERQERDREQMIQKQREIKEKGFLKVMCPSIIAVVLVVVLWFVWIWLLIRAAYYQGLVRTGSPAHRRAGVAARGTLFWRYPDRWRRIHAACDGCGAA